MTDLQGALGLSQLERLDEFVERRNQLAQAYDKLLAQSPIQRPTILEGNYSSFHLYVIRLNTRNQPKIHKRIFKGLRKAGIGVNLHYMPVHLQPYFRRCGFEEGYCPESEAYGREAISLPLYPSITDLQQKRVVKFLKNMI